MGATESCERISVLSDETAEAAEAAEVEGESGPSTEVEPEGLCGLGVIEDVATGERGIHGGERV